MKASKLFPGSVVIVEKSTYTPFVFEVKIPDFVLYAPPLFIKALSNTKTWLCWILDTDWVMDAEKAVGQAPTILNRECVVTGDLSGKKKTWADSLGPFGYYTSIAGFFGDQNDDLTTREVLYYIVYIVFRGQLNYRIDRKREAHVPHRLPEKQSQSIDTFAQNYD